MLRVVKTLSALLWRGFFKFSVKTYELLERLTFRLFTVKGILVYLHGSFVLGVPLVLLFALALAGLKMMGILALLYGISFTSVLLHELGHVAAASLFGIKTEVIYLHMLGGAACLESNLKKPHQEFVTAIAGPLVNVFLLSAGLGLLKVTVGLPVPEWAAELIWPTLVGLVVIVNIVMLFFNLIPAYPMDGGRILRSALGMLGLSRKLSTYVAVGVSLVCCTFMIVLGFLGLPTLAGIGTLVGLSAIWEIVLGDHDD